MARFHASITGSRQAATRVGTTKSGINAELRSGLIDQTETFVDASITTRWSEDFDVSIGDRVNLRVEYREKLLLNVSIDPDDANAFDYDPTVRYYLAQIRHSFDGLQRAIDNAREHRNAFADRIAKRGQNA